MPEKNKTMVFSRSFRTAILDYEALERIISLFATNLAKKLREKKLIAQTVTLFIRTSPFDEHYYQNQFTLPLDENTQDTLEHVKISLKCLPPIYKQFFL